MDAEPATGLQELLLVRLAELGELGAPMALRSVVNRAGGALNYERLRAIARGERAGVLTAREAAALASALEVPLSQVEAAATVLRRA